MVMILYLHPDLIRAGKLSAVDATQLCSLLLPQTNRMRVHRVLRLIKKAGENSELRLSTTQTNLQVVRGGEGEI